jgi:hypothetical protein
MERVRRLLLFAALSVASAGVVGLGSAASAQAAPSLTVAPSAAPVGATVIVSARNFPPLIQNLQVEVCGNQGAGGSADCDQSGARNFASGSGIFQVNLVVTRPPAPCPCAIAAYAPSLGAPVTVPFTVLGAPTAPVVTPQLHTGLVINQVRLVGSNSWGAWFGAPPRRTLLLTVTNTGNVAAVSPSLVLRIGRGANPSDTVGSPILRTIDPKGTVTYQIPANLPALSFGTYTVEGQLGPAGESSGFTTTTSSLPWGLIAVAIVLVQVTLVWIRNRIRDIVWMGRVRRSMAAAPIAEGSAPDHESGVERQPTTSPSEPEVESPESNARAIEAEVHGGMKRPSGAGGRKASGRTSSSASPSHRPTSPASSPWRMSR